MLKAESISKSYGGVKVLQGIDIQIGKGEIVSIVGASGAGKTTLLHILGTLDAPDLGRVVIKKVNVFELGKKDLATFRNKEIGFVFQSHSLFPEFTALENVCIPAFIRKKVGIKKKARRLLDQLGLSTRLNHKPSELSGGERQRVAVARALINKPSVVFADEPSGNLDSLHASELHDLFFDLRDEVGQTFVLVTHNTSLAKMADTTFKIKDGKIYHQR